MLSVSAAPFVIPVDPVLSYGRIACAYTLFHSQIKVNT
jgi:hypothetical protein